MSEFVAIRTTIRPTTDVPFYGMPTGVREHIDQVYKIGSAQLLRTEISLSDDGKTLVMTNTWASNEAYDAFMADPIVASHIAALNQYCVDHNFTVLLGA
jgi:hypothetical protein